MLQVAICDDDMNICSQIEQYLLDYKEKVHVKIDIEVFCHGEELLKFIKNEHKFDLIFLDIELGSTTGINVGREIRNNIDDNIGKIVFITAKDGYECELFDLQPFNFLKKPIQYSKIQKCIDLVVKILYIQNQTFEVKKGYDVIKYAWKEIIYFEKVGRKINIVTENESDMFFGTLSNIKTRLPDFFIQPHSSFVINFEKILRTSKDSIVMSNKIEIPISQRNLKYIRSVLLDSERNKKDGVI